MYGFNLCLNHPSVRASNFTNRYFPKEHKILYDQNRVFLSVNSRLNYPFFYEKTSSGFIYIEGHIYSCPNAIDTFRKWRKASPNILQSNIKEFVNQNSGEFWVIILDKAQLIMFSDFFGMLPVFYSEMQNKLIISRNFNFINENLDKIKYDKVGLADKLFFNFNIGKKTIINSIKKIEKGGIFLVPKETAKIKYSPFNFKLSFNTSNRIKKVEFIEELAYLCKSKVHSLFDYLETNKINAICDLTGGVDSRTIVASIGNIPNNLTFQCSTLFGTDEDKIAKKIIKKLNLDDERITIIPNSSLLPINNPYDFAYETEANYNISGINLGRSSLKFSKQINSNCSIKIGGLGFNDMIRKGYKLDDTNLFEDIKNNRFVPTYHTSIELVCRIVNIEVDEYLNSIRNVINSWEEKENNNIYQRLYFNYQLQLASRQAEETERSFFWNTCPGWNKEIMLFCLNNCKRNWRGYELSLKLLKLLNSDLSKTAFNHKFIPVNNSFKLKLLTLKENSTSYMRLREYYKTIVSCHDELGEVNQSLDLGNFPNTLSILDMEIIKKNWTKLGGNFNIAETLAFYIESNSCQLKNA